MSDDQENDSNHIRQASETAQLGVLSLLFAAYSFVLGFSEWTKNRHIVIQVGITSGISLGLAYVINAIGQFYFETFYQQAVYASGLRLRLLPIPLSIVIYALVLALFLLGFSLDSSIRDLQSEMDEIQEELNIQNNRDDNNET